MQAVGLLLVSFLKLVNGRKSDLFSSEPFDDCKGLGSRKVGLRSLETTS